MYKCKKKDCIYRAPDGAVNTCDFRTITGVGRGCSVEGCIHYKTGERANRQSITGIIPHIPKIPNDIPYSLSQAARIIPIPTQNITKPTQKVTERKESKTMSITEDTAEMEKDYKEKLDASNSHIEKMMDSMKREWPPIPTDAKAKAEWYDLVFAELTSGRSPHDVAADFGITIKQINMARGQRKRAERKAAEKQGSTPEPKPEPIQSVATTLNEPGMLVAGLHYWDEELVNATIVHARAMLNDLSELDESVRIKVITLARIKNMINEVFNPEVPN